MWQRDGGQTLVINDIICNGLMEKDGGKRKQDRTEANPQSRCDTHAGIHSNACQQVWPRRFLWQKRIIS